MSGFWDTTTGWMIKCSAWVGLFMAPAKTTMIAIGFLVLGDLITGIWAALKRGETFSSARLRATVTKTFGYQLAIVLSYVTESQLLPEIPVLKVIAGLIASTELVSALENLSSITGVPLGEVIRKLFDKRPLPIVPILPILENPGDEAGDSAAGAAVDAAKTAVKVAEAATVVAEKLAAEKAPHE